MFRLGLEKLIESDRIKRDLSHKRVAYVAHPSSTNRKLIHGLDLLKREGQFKLTAAFGPQHGVLGDKQDNMIESETFVDPYYEIPIYSLYGEVRRPTEEMLEKFDVLLFDLQDVGCRIYTYLTTLVYLMEDCARAGKSLWVLDRPNPAGRPVEGTYLNEEYFSFVGAVKVPMRHGLTLGEMAMWIKDSRNLDIDLKVISMDGYKPESEPGFGWPSQGFSWINPSPNLSNPFSARMFCGTVLFEGTNFSEGRGTTRALEQFGAPGWSGRDLIFEMIHLNADWLKGALIRQVFFEPTFQKFSGELCCGLSIHVDDLKYYEHYNFKPYRLASLFLKAVKNLYPEFDLWRKPPYEYESELLPIDMLSGSDLLRNWVDKKDSKISELDEKLITDESDWLIQRQSYLLY